MLKFNLKGLFIFFDMLMLAKKTLTVFVLFLPSVALCLTINEELRSDEAKQSSFINLPCDFHEKSISLVQN